MALIWERDIDLIGRSVTVNEQVRLGCRGLPKGGRRRTVPLTEATHAALKALQVVRLGAVIRAPGLFSGDDAQNDERWNRAAHRICRRAGLPEHAWHTLRHTYGTHCALLGVNPWSLQQWLGHEGIETTMKYVHTVKDHRRPIPAEVIAAGARETDPDRRIVAMLDARTWHQVWHQAVSQSGS